MWARFSCMRARNYLVSPKIDCTTLALQWRSFISTCDICDSENLACESEIHPSVGFPPPPFNNAHRTTQRPYCKKPRAMWFCLPGIYASAKILYASPKINPSVGFSQICEAENLACESGNYLVSPKIDWTTLALSQVQFSWFRNHLQNEIFLNFKFPKTPFTTWPALLLDPLPRTSDRSSW